MKIFAVVLCGVMLAGCGGGFSSAQCFMGVKAVYPDSEISMLPKNDYRFLVRKPNGDIVIAETMAFDTSVTKEVMVFKGRP